MAHADIYASSLNKVSVSQVKYLRDNYCTSNELVIQVKSEGDTVDININLLDSDSVEWLQGFAFQLNSALKALELGDL